MNCNFLHKHFGGEHKVEKHPKSITRMPFVKNNHQIYNPTGPYNGACVGFSCWLHYIRRPFQLPHWKQINCSAVGAQTCRSEAIVKVVDVKRGVVAGVCSPAWTFPPVRALLTHTKRWSGGKERQGKTHKREMKWALLMKGARAPPHPACAALLCQVATAFPTFVRAEWEHRIGQIMSLSGHRMKHLCRGLPAVCSSQPNHSKVNVLLYENFLLTEQKKNCTEMFPERTGTGAINHSRITIKTQQFDGFL